MIQTLTLVVVGMEVRQQVILDVGQISVAEGVY